MIDYVLGVDVWEGSLDINEPELKQGGVEFIIVRINDINGGLHRDSGFAAQWQQAAGFVRFPYFVYNPWVSGKANFDYLTAILPPDAPKRIAIDVEVKKDGYSPIEYAANVTGMVNSLVALGMWPVIYTGAWFLPFLANWPKTDYWFARYPYSMYPAAAQEIGWDGLKRLVGALAWSPWCNVGPCRLWQCSGDRLKLPGCQGRAVDVNCFQGSLEELRAWVGLPPAPPEYADDHAALTALLAAARENGWRV